MSDINSETYESISGAVQLVASQVGKYFGGPFGQAYATFLTGQNAWVASVADLATKVQNGTATGEDFADVASKTASTLAAFGVLTGTAAPWTMIAAGAAGGALWAWKNREQIVDYGEQVLNGINKIDNLISKSSGNSLVVRQYSVNGSEFISYQLIDHTGFKYAESARVSGTVADQLELLAPAVTVIATRSGDVSSIDLPMSNGQYVLDLNLATQINQVEIPVNGLQFSGIVENIQNSYFGGELNSVEYTNSLLGAAGISNIEVYSPGSLSAQFEYVTNYFTSNSYGDLMDPYYIHGHEVGDTQWIFEDYCRLAGKLGLSEDDQWINYIGSEYYDHGSPIAIDLQGDGINTTLLRDSDVRFDITGDKSQEKTAWLSGGDAFISWDRNGNGIIDDVSELFGGLNRGEGYAELAALDGNGDGWIDEGDSAFGLLSVWQDVNENGITEDGELQSLYKSGVSRLGVVYTTTDIYSNGNLIGEQSSAIVNGNIVALGDIYFAYEQNDRSQLPSGDAISVEEHNLSALPHSSENSRNIAIEDWYAETSSKRISDMRVVVEAATNSMFEELLPSGVQKDGNYGYTSGLVNADPAKVAVDGALTSWALTNAVTSFQLAGSDTAALSGDLAYQYGTLAGVGVTPALATLSDANLGSAAQTLTPLSCLQAGAVRVS